jgi:hypothetical protein
MFSLAGFVCFLIGVLRAVLDVLHLEKKEGRQTQALE